MSDLPPYQPGYAGIPNYYNGPAASTRPASVTGIAITGIVVGAIGLVCRGFGMAMAVVMMTMNGRRMFAGQGFVQQPAFARIGAMSALVDLAMWGWLLIVSIGALRLRPWARTGMLAWAFAMLGWQIIWCIIEFVFLLPMTTALTTQMQKSMGGAGSSTNLSLIVQSSAIGGYVFWLLTMSVLPVLVLSMWTRPAVIAAFRGQTPTPAPPGPPMP